MDLKHEIMVACQGHEYKQIIEVLDQLKNHYEACKNLSDSGRKEK